MNVLPNFEAESIDDIYAKVGEGLVTAWDVLKAVYPGYKQSKLEKVVKSLKVPVFSKSVKKDKSKAEPLKIKGLIPGMAVHFAGCCHPLPGDRIVGIVTTGKGVAVHRSTASSWKSLRRAGTLAGHFLGGCGRRYAARRTAESDACQRAGFVGRVVQPDCAQQRQYFQFEHRQPDGELFRADCRC